MCINPSISFSLKTLGCVMAIAAWSGLAQAAVVNLSPVKDTTLYGESDTLSNGSGAHFFSGSTGGGNVRRGLLAFDIAGSIPAGSTINSASLTLSMSRSQGSTEFVSLHRLLTDWGEGTSNAPGNEGGGTTAADNDATWRYTFFVSANPPSSPAWSSLGGDFVGSSSAFTTVIGIGFYTWGSTTTMESDVQGWLDSPASSLGWILIGNEKASFSAKRFDSRNHATSSVRPVLTIDFTPPAITGACCQGNGVCQLETMADCALQGNAYKGDGTSCTPSPCGPILGACCLNDGSCSELSATDCTSAGGTYQGDLSVCTNGLCPVVLAPFVDALPIPPVATPTVGTIGLAATYDIEMVQIEQQLHRDLPPTTLWTYNGTYPGPTILARRDFPVTVNWINNLQNSNGTLRTDHYLDVDLCPHGAQNEAKVVVHLHGGHVPAEFDGYPEDTFLPGNMDTYVYPNNQRSSLIWYHDHALGITRLNVYMGLAAAYIIRDSVEDALILPSGEFEVPLIIQDRTFNADGTLKYPSVWEQSFFGDTMLVNGMAWPFHNVKQGKYRFRVLNGCNARTLTLALSTGQTFQQIGTDGGLLTAPVTLSELTLGPAERADLIVDFSGSAPGTEIILTNSAPAPFPGTPGQGVIPEVMKFVVVGTSGFSDAIPASLSTLEILDPAAAAVDRQFELRQFSEPCAGSEWLINGLKWNDITEFPRLGTTETWTFVNRSGISHPMHIHLDFFQVLYSQDFLVVGPDITTTGPRVPPPPNEAGWKDTVMVPPQKLVKVIARFEDYPGLFAYHCHILEHEDHEMMRQFRAVVFGDWDVDGDVDLIDFATFVDCMEGPGNAPNPTLPTTAQECLQAFDSDFDGDVDLDDFATFELNFGN
ncbi:MAG: multicopper oxidase family protein [Planctomycetes bacterium]|nr:multicopper oxidase family protein [Planctomycetota bacterium]